MSLSNRRTQFKYSNCRQVGAEQVQFIFRSFWWQQNDEPTTAMLLEAEEAKDSTDNPLMISDVIQWHLSRCHIVLHDIGLFSWEY